MSLLQWSLICQVHRYQCLGSLFRSSPYPPDFDVPKVISNAFFFSLLHWFCSFGVLPLLLCFVQLAYLEVRRPSFKGWIIGTISELDLLEGAETEVILSAQLQCMPRGTFLPYDWSCLSPSRVSGCSAFIEDGYGSFQGPSWQTSRVGRGTFTFFRARSLPNTLSPPWWRLSSLLQKSLTLSSLL